jgi:hypothetical protein
MLVSLVTVDKEVTSPLVSQTPGKQVQASQLITQPADHPGPVRNTRAGAGRWTTLINYHVPTQHIHDGYDTTPTAY